MLFVERLKSLLKNNNMTAKELTVQLGVGGTRVNDWEKEKSSPSPDILIRLSQIFNVSIDWLLTGREHSSGSVHVSGSVTGNNILGSNHSTVTVHNGGTERTLTDSDIVEILRVAELLDSKRRFKLRGLAYELESEMKEGVKNAP